MSRYEQAVELPPWESDPDGWDVLTFDLATGADREAMAPGTSVGCHFDYVGQRWVDGHDHAHFHAASAHSVDTADLVFCGADLVTCQEVQRDPGDKRQSAVRCALWALESQREQWIRFSASALASEDWTGVALWDAKVDAMNLAVEILTSECEL